MMDQQTFDQIYNRLTDRRRQILNLVVAGETDQNIADYLGIQEATVRKYIERVIENFGLANASPHKRRSKRPALVSLVTHFKSELLQMTPALSSQGKPKQQNPLIPQLRRDLHQAKSRSRYIECNLKSLESNSDNSDKLEIAKMLNHRGHDLYMEGDFQSAIFYLEWAIKFNRAFASAHYNLGSAYEKLGDVSKAYKHYQRAAKSDHKTTYAAISNLARLDILNNSPDRAIERIMKVIDSATDPVLASSLYKNLGWAYFLKGDDQKAEQLLRQSLQLNSDRAAPNCLLAQVLEKKGCPEEAYLYWEKCLECDSNPSRSIQAPWRSPELDLWQQQARLRLESTNSRLDIGRNQ